MNGSKAGFAQGKQNTHRLSSKFLWWLSTAETELIADCVIDRNRYKIVGMSVLATWLFATIAWAYFFTTATDSFFVSVALGCFMGFVILTIDRTLIKGINKASKNKLIPLLFRGIMAITIGTFMAQPAVLYLFKKEIKLQTSLDNEARKMQKRKELDNLYASQKLFAIEQKQAIEKKLSDKYTEVNAARTNYLAETDGSGGSGKLGISTIALAKKAEYEKLQTEYNQLKVDIQPRQDSLQSAITTIETTIKTQQTDFEKLLNNGFLIQIQALQNLIKNNNALAFRYYLIVIILMLIELMPVIAKLLLPTGTYEEKVQLQEEMEKKLAADKLSYALALKQYQNNTAFETDKNMVDSFFSKTSAKKQQKLDAYNAEWESDESTSYLNYWQKIKNTMFTS